jgi:arylsulfatase A-like enzyme
VPFFVLLHVFDPHDPYRPYPPYDTLWVDAAEIEEHEQRARQVAAFIPDPVLRSMQMPTREQLDAAAVDPEAFQRVRRAWYDGSIRAMDAELGKLFEFLRSSGLASSTVVAVTSDHGEEFLEHGRTGHGHSVYGELVDVPLILWGPGSLPAGRVVAPTVESVDLMPTLLELSGLAPPAGVQGVSRLALARDGAGAGRAVGFAEKNRMLEPAGPPPRDLASRTVVRGGWKLIHNPQRPDQRPELELFDHSGDPLDSANLIAEHPEVAEQMLELLSRWQRAVSAARLEGGSPEAEMASKDLEVLRSLGYLP